MKSIHSIVFNIIVMFVLITVMSAVGYPVFGQTSPFKGITPNGKGNIEFNFPNVDIQVFIKYISELTGKNFVVDDRVKGQVSIISPGKIPVEEAYDVFESVLEIHGYTTVDAGEIIKIVPTPDAKSKSIKTMIGEEAVVPEDQIVTQIIPLRYANPTEIQRLFTPLVSKSSVILSYPQNNTLIVTDAYSNVRRLMRILKVIDTPGMGEEISVIPLKYADADEMERIMNSVFQARKHQSRDTIEEMIHFVADKRTNTIILMATEDDTVKIKRLISLLDKEIPQGKGKIHVYYLENATAEDLATVLENLPTSQSETDRSTSTPLISENVRITADRSTNSLIIMAEPGEYAVLEEIIKKLDIPRAMVYIESLIMEVNVSKSFDLGIDWSVAGKTTVDNKEGVIGGGFSGTGGVNSLDVVSPEGFSMGIVGGAIEIVTEAGTLTFPNIGAIVNAFETDEDVHILSTPQILTTDNEEAKITVGRNVPFQTQSTTTDVNTFNSYEYRDVGIMLEITPHISKDGLVRLKITQDVTSIPENPNNPTDRPTTLKRSITTTVIVQNQNTVVIGGLIDDTFTTTENRVPCLGNLPGLRWLFKSLDNSRQKTNLYVFLTPRVIQSPEDAAEIYSRKKEGMNVLEEGNIKMYPAPEKFSPVLPAEKKIAN
jgi:general secretion pathway protein D